MSATPPAAGRVERMVRLLIGANELRRPSDRWERTVIATLLATFVAAVTVVSLVSVHIYRSERAAGANLHPEVAVLTEKGPIDMVDGVGEAPARWRVPGGRVRSGTLTMVFAPDIENAGRGGHVRIWVTRAGDPVVPPPDEAAMLLSATGIAVWLLLGTGAFLMLCYWLSRLVLDRRRLAAWESSWARVGPRWTTHR